MKDNIYRVPVLAKLPGKKEIQWFNNDLFLLNDGSGQEGYFFDGVGVIDGVLHSYHQKSDISKLNFKEIKPFDIKGALSVYHKDDQTSRIISDFIGSSFIYFYKKNGFELYSSCLKSLKEVLLSLNILLKKSLIFKACENIFGNGGFGYSSYNDVYTLPANSMVIARNNNIKVVEFSLYDFLKKEDISYEECLSYLKKDLSNNIKAITTSSYKYKLAHITGGMDSRLVVAAISSLGLIDEFELCCLGKKGDLDYDNASLISAELEAKFSNRENYITTTHPSTIEEKYAWEHMVTEGMFVNQSFHQGMIQNKDLIILSGGYGGILRTFYSYGDLDSGWNCTNSLPIFRQIMSQKSNKSALIKKEFLDEIIDKTFLFVEEAKLYGLSKVEMSEMFFALNRNRYYIGNITKTASKFTSRFDVLYSPYLFKLGFLISDEKRVLREPIFDLMYSLSPKLATLPFGTTKWDDDLIRSKGVKLKSFNNKKLNILNIEKKSISPLVSWMPSISKENRALAKKMKGTAWQVQIYPQLQKESLLLWKKHRDILEKFYNKEALDFYLKKEHRNRVDIRKVINIYATMLLLTSQF